MNKGDRVRLGHHYGVKVGNFTFLPSVFLSFPLSPILRNEEKEMVTMCYTTAIQHLPVAYVCANRRRGMSDVLLLIVMLIAQTLKKGKKRCVP